MKKTRKILVIGINGLIGGAILDYFSSIDNVIVLGEDLNTGFDISNKVFLEDYFKQNGNIEYIMNASGLNDHITGSIDKNALILDTDIDHLDQYIKINVKSVAYLIEIAKRNLKNLVSIVNISSLYGQRSPYHPMYKKPKSLSYTISKHALDGLTKYYGALYAKEGVRINAIRMGGVLNNQNQDFINSFNDKVPIGRMANKDEILGLVDFLLSDKSSYIVGTTINMDGGYHIW